ncbi:hypothetical protein AAFN47_15100 [Hoeflea sp. CAU 1731]
MSRVFGCNLALFREFGILRFVRRIRRRGFGLDRAVDPGLERLFPPGAGLVAVTSQQAAGIFHAARGARVHKRGDEAHYPAVFRPGEAFAGERPLHQLRVVAMVRVGGVQVPAGLEIGERAFAGFKPGFGFGQRQGAEAAFVAGDEISEREVGLGKDDAEPQAHARRIGPRCRAVPAGIAGNRCLAFRRPGACALGGIRPVAAGDVGCHCSVGS